MNGVPQVDLLRLALLLSMFTVVPAAFAWGLPFGCGYLLKGKQGRLSGIVTIVALFVLLASTVFLVILVAGGVAIAGFDSFAISDLVIGWLSGETLDDAYQIAADNGFWVNLHVLIASSMTFVLSALTTTFIGVYRFVEWVINKWNRKEEADAANS